MDFNGKKYTVDGSLVGSTGTETQAFQLLKDNRIVFKNGTIYSAKAKMLVQNYSNLTLENMVLTLDNPNYHPSYTLSNNNGNVVIDGTTINANPAGGFAFDVCRYSSYTSVNVEVKGTSVINGDIEISASGSDAKDGFGLTLTSGTLNGDIVVDPSAAAAMEAAPEKASVTKSSAVDVDAPEGYMWVDDGEGQKIAPVVAKIGEIGYATLLEAIIAAPENATILLLRDITVSEEIALTKSVTFDLGGNIITAGRLFGVAANLDIDVTITANGGSIVADRIFSAYDGLTVGSLTVNGGTYTSTSCAFMFYGLESVSIKDAIISGTVWFGNKGATSVVIENTTVSHSGDVAIYLGTVGTASLTNVEATSENGSAVEIKSGAVAISGGKYIGKQFAGTSGDISHDGTGSGSAAIFINNAYASISGVTPDVTVSATTEVKYADGTTDNAMYVVADSTATGAITVDASDRSIATYVPVDTVDIVTINDSIVNEYSVTFTAGEHTQFADVTGVTDGKVGHNGAFSFKVTTDAGYDKGLIVKNGETAMTADADGFYHVADVTSAIAITSETAINTYTVSFAAGDYGSVEPVSVENVPYGTLFTIDGNKITLVNTTVTATADAATAEYTYAFESWNVTLETQVTEDMIVTATFSATKNKYAVTLTSGANTAFSEVQGLDSENKVVYGEAFSFKVTTDVGYDKGLTVMNGETALSADEDGVYSVTVTSAVEIITSTVINTYTVSFAAGDYGSVEPVSVENVPYGTLFTIDGSKITLVNTIVTATANASTAEYTYAFEFWSVTSETQVTEDMTVTATFSATKNKYLVSFNRGNHTSFTDVQGLDDDNKVAYGEDLTFKVTTDAGYSEHLVVKSDGVAISAIGGVYTVNVTAAVEISTETRISQFDVTFVTAVHTSVAEVIGLTDGKVDYGDGFAFTVSADTGYYVSAVTANDTVIEAVQDIYSVTDVTSAVTVTLQGAPKVFDIAGPEGVYFVSGVDSGKVTYGVDVKMVVPVSAGTTPAVSYTVGEAEAVTIPMENGFYTIAGELVLGDILVSVESSPETFAVTYAAPSTGSISVTQASYGAAFSTVLTPAAGYVLPGSVTLVMGGAVFTDFTYDAETGEIAIVEGKVSSGILIMGSCATPAGEVSIYLDPKAKAMDVLLRTETAAGFSGTVELSCTYAYYSGDIFVVGNYKASQQVQTDDKEYRMTMSLADAKVGQTDICQYIRSAYATYSGSVVQSAVVFIPVYSINYVLDGGVNPAENPASFSFNCDAIVLTSATKEGSEFGGWFSDPEFTAQVEQIDTSMAGNVTVYAKWL